MLSAIPQKEGGGIVGSRSEALAKFIHKPISVGGGGESFSISFLVLFIIFFITDKTSLNGLTFVIWLPI